MRLGALRPNNGMFLSSRRVDVAPGVCVDHNDAKVMLGSRMKLREHATRAEALCNAESATPYSWFQPAPRPLHDEEKAVFRVVSLA